MKNVKLEYLDDEIERLEKERIAYLEVDDNRNAGRI